MLSPPVQNIAAYGLCWFRRMMAIWIVIASVAYFGTLVAAWPARRVAEERMERVINEGEMALVRDGSYQ